MTVQISQIDSDSLDTLNCLKQKCNINQFKLAGKYSISYNNVDNYFNGLFILSDSIAKPNVCGYYCWLCNKRKGIHIINNKFIYNGFAFLVYNNLTIFKNYYQEDTYNKLNKIVTTILDMKLKFKVVPNFYIDYVPFVGVT